MLFATFFANLAGSSTKEPTTSATLPKAPPTKSAAPPKTSPINPPKPPQYSGTPVLGLIVPEPPKRVKTSAS